MRAVIQRVSFAAVAVVESGTSQEIGRIAAGFLILLGVRTDDTEADARWLADKIANIRLFEDQDGKLNRSLRDEGASALVISNFTLYADCRKGRRPGFSDAASVPAARTLYEQFALLLRKQGISVECGQFGAHMEVSLTNQGPVTIVLESPRVGTNE